MKTLRLMGSAVDHVMVLAVMAFLWLVIPGYAIYFVYHALTESTVGEWQLFTGYFAFLAAPTAIVAAGAIVVVPVYLLWRGLFR